MFGFAITERKEIINKEKNFMDNLIKNGGGLSFREPQEITLPYTATRDCIINFTLSAIGSYWYVYLTKNDDANDNSCCFSGLAISIGLVQSVYFPLRKGDTIKLKDMSAGDVVYRVM